MTLWLYYQWRPGQSREDTRRAGDGHTLGPQARVGRSTREGLRLAGSSGGRGHHVAKNPGEVGDGMQK